MLRARSRAGSIVWHDQHGAGPFMTRVLPNGTIRHAFLISLLACMSPISCSSDNDSGRGGAMRVVATDVLNQGRWIVYPNASNTYQIAYSCLPLTAAPRNAEGRADHLRRPRADEVDGVQELDGVHGVLRSEAKCVHGDRVLGFGRGSRAQPADNTTVQELRLSFGSAEQPFPRRTHRPLGRAALTISRRGQGPKSLRAAARAHGSAWSPAGGGGPRRAGGSHRHGGSTEAPRLEAALSGLGRVRTELPVMLRAEARHGRASVRTGLVGCRLHTAVIGE